ncbi:MAG: pyruvate ferredoxin oxidoreductase [Caldisphaera sp.]|uniref:thiamine pyrophosphate-dependent enzyme n=1 Tax=Caldisphaera sp. TaxID=2060322 RepID=UPI000CAA2C12|nr:thiamine pyrophosphate-dependent enzyme [Caldisphaera sp.]PMP59854.1 MAG: pyruvate ferredoxin oxidoreductase [Caldisphaera sp.]PMP91101.1 MAG: pyruvate ferredoxin oxidoreductase [Caldisphaera sp.]
MSETKKVLRIKSLYDLPREELFISGHGLCPGCTAGTIMRMLTKVTGKDTIVVNATGCVEVSTTRYPYSNWLIPWLHSAFENSGASASGIVAAIKAMKRKGIMDKDKDVKVVVVAGDGGTVDIGLQSLSGMLERKDPVMYVLYDNEAYMNTGIQRSGSTPHGAWTTTTPAGKVWRGEWRDKKDIAGIAAAHHIPYVATANPAYPMDMINKFARGLEVLNEGPSFIQVLMACTTGWRFDPALGITISRLATETGIFPIYEIDHGNFRVTFPIMKRKPVKEYLKLQGRFAHLTDEEINEIQKMVDQKVETINKMAGKTVIGPVG